MLDQVPSSRLRIGARLVRRRWISAGIIRSSNMMLTAGTIAFSLQSVQRLEVMGIGRVQGAKALCKEWEHSDAQQYRREIRRCCE